MESTIFITNDYSFPTKKTSKEKRKSYKKVSDKRIGETRLNTLGSTMWITEYVDSTNVTVQFKDGFAIRTTYQQFLNGCVKNPNDKSVFGTGIIGIGKYTNKDQEGNVTQKYSCWMGMLGRCYSLKVQAKQPTYRDCSVDPEWHNFQNFAKWYDENYYNVEGQRMELDKDILFKGNKVYSPDNCILVPHNINSLFTKRQNDRGELPIGVTYNIVNELYHAQCRIEGKKISLGDYKTSEEAFNAYKLFKEKNIKDMAEKYKKQIPVSLYKAMLEYKVSIND